jgi:Holliday junction DNA helicase RuvA
VIAFLEGEVVHKGATSVVLAVGGVGYDVSVPTSVVSRLPGVGKTARIHTRMVVRDDSMTLYGFSSTDERELFDLLTGVTGVGPKVGLSFLSALSADALTIAPGVGKKVAQRVVVDLRDRFGGEAGLPSEGGPIVDVRDALVSLGLTPQEAAEATRDVDADGREVDDMLREALQKVGR